MTKSHKFYRRLYEKHFGPIPKDQYGRSYEIHHIDGNHANNSIENLQAVSIEEHYSIHEKNGDWYACLKIGAKMKMSAQELSEMASRNNKKMLEQGIHPLAKRKDGSSHATDRISNGTWHMSKRADGSSITSDRVRNGTHALANYTGKKHFNYDHNKYCFVNRVTGEKIHATQYELSQLGVSRYGISHIVHGRRKSYKNWIVISTQQKGK